MTLKSIENSVNEIKKNTMWKYFLGKNCNKTLSGDVYELLLKKALKKLLPQYNIGYGIVYKNNKEKSGEMDIIIYHGEPIECIEDLVVVTPKQVKAVLQVKGYIPSPKNDFQKIKDNLFSAKNLNRSIKTYCFVTTNSSKKSLSKYIYDMKNLGIDGYHVLWDMPGPNGQKVDGEGSLDTLLETLKNL